MPKLSAPLSEESYRRFRVTTRRHGLSHGAALARLVERANRDPSLLDPLPPDALAEHVVAYIAKTGTAGGSLAGFRPKLTEADFEDASREAIRDAGN